MRIGVWLLACAAVSGAAISADDKPPTPAGEEAVFRSDVTLVRVDAQVLDRDNRAVTGLSAQDFVLSEAGHPVPIRNFASESLPVDVLLLLDVSVSMRPNIERIASAAHEALGVLGETDRVGIMVFDRSSRVRLPFKSDHAVVEREFESLLRHEGFNGGTDIIRGIIDAAKYVGREARKDARRAVVIVTDDQTEIKSGFNDYRANRALTSANAVLMALLAPDAMLSGGYGRHPGGGYPGAGGGSWPGGGGGGGWGGGLGGVIIGGGGMGIPGSRRRGPMGGGGGGYPRGPYPGGGPGGSRTESAGTAEIARQSGGDSMPADDASSLETALARIRQRYALYFYLPDGVKPGEERNINVELADNSRRRNPGAEVRFRRVYMAPGGLDTNTAPEPAVVAQVPPEPAKSTVDQPESSERTEPPRQRRRPASDDSITRSSGPDARTRSTDSSGSTPPN